MNSLIGMILEYLDKHPVPAPIIGALITASAAIWVAGWAAPNFARLMKKTDAAFEFTKQFSKLMLLKDKLNRKYKDGDSCDRAEAESFYFKYFDLMMNQYRFFRS